MRSFHNFCSSRNVNGHQIRRVVWARHVACLRTSMNTAFRSENLKERQRGDIVQDERLTN
jgi:hypothetical protein